MIVRCPVERFNALVRDGTAGRKIARILEEIRPESVWFTELGGERCGFIVVDVPEPSAIPSLCEPWFLTFDARIELHPAMNAEDLMAAGLEDLGRKYG
jgi:hypothetical protein